MFRVTAGAVGPVVVLAVTVSACGAVETPAGEVTTHRVGGEVRGLWRGADGVALRLEADGASSLVTAGNGAFTGDRSAPIRLPLGATTLALALTASGGLSKTYQLMFDRGGKLLDQRVYGKASNTGAGDAFACSVALSGDTLAVGAYFESSAATGI